MTTKHTKIDKEEQDILQAIENDSLVSVPISKKEQAVLKKIARNTFAKTRSINIRISERDLLWLKAKASKEGLPYQTFISSTLHKEAEKINQ